MNHLAFDRNDANTSWIMTVKKPLRSRCQKEPGGDATQMKALKRTKIRNARSRVTQMIKMINTAVENRFGGTAGGGIGLGAGTARTGAGGADLTIGLGTSVKAVMKSRQPW